MRNIVNAKHALRSGLHNDDGLFEGLGILGVLRIRYTFSVSDLRV